MVTKAWQKEATAGSKENIFSTITWKWDVALNSQSPPKVRYTFSKALTPEGSVTSHKHIHQRGTKCVNDPIRNIFIHTTFPSFQSNIYFIKKQ